MCQEQRSFRGVIWAVTVELSTNSHWPCHGAAGSSLCAIIQEKDVPFLTEFSATSEPCLGAGFEELWWAALQLPMLQDSRISSQQEISTDGKDHCQLCWSICVAWFGILVFNWQRRPQRLCSELDCIVVHKYIPRGFHSRLPENLILLIIRSFCYSLMTIRRNLTSVYI